MVMTVAVIMVTTRNMSVGVLVAVLAPMRMHMTMSAATMVLFAQTADVLGGLPALGHLIHHIGLHALSLIHI